MSKAIKEVGLDEEYERFVENHPSGHFAQSLKYAKIRKEWENEKIVVRDENGTIKGSMLLLIRKTRGFNSCLIYVPRGPVFDLGDKETFGKLIKEAEAIAKKRNAFMIKMDPDIENSNIEFKNMAKDNNFKVVEKIKSIKDIMMPRFVMRMNNLRAKTEEELFESFKQKTRYNIRLATKKGVVIREGNKEDIAKLKKIMDVTGTRDNFAIPSEQEFEDMYDIMGKEHSQILLAEYEGEPIACTFNFLYGDKVWYMYGGSLNEKRNLMGTYLLQWEGIKWAKQNNCNIYDFRGICATSMENKNEGLYRFKEGFNPDFMEFTEIYKIYKPFVYFMYKKVFPIYQKIKGKK